VFLCIIVQECNQDGSLRSIYKGVVFIEDMANKQLVLDLDDPRSAAIAEVLQNASAKKVLGVLAEREMSESELSEALGVPMTTIGYTMKKLVEAGLVEIDSGILWSVKGKRIKKYRVVQKRIVIEPKRLVRGVIPTIVASGFLSLGVKWLLSKRTVGEVYSVGSSGGYDAAVGIAESGKMAVSEGVGVVAPSSIPSSGSGEIMTQTYQALSGMGNEWAWFLLGSLTGLLLYFVLSWRSSGKI